MHEKPTVAVVGLGAMGRRLAGNLLEDGHEVVVANRSSAARDELGASGARVAETPRDAAAGADIVIVAVTDDDASRAVWLDARSGALADLAPDAVGVECSTITPGWARELAGRFEDADRRFAEAPMIGSRPQVEARALVHLLAGDGADAAEPVLAVSAATIHRLSVVGEPATLKLVVNAALATQVAMLAELRGLLSRAPLDEDAALDVLAGLPVMSPAAIRALGAMRAQTFAPNFPVSLVEKDLRYLLRVAEEVDGDLPVVAAVLERYRAALASGHGDEDLTAVARLHAVDVPAV